MALTSIVFSEENGKYVGKFTANAPFAVEVKNGGRIVKVAINYVGANDEYAEVVGSRADGDVYVRNFGTGAEIFPVYVKVVCDENPSYGGYQEAE